MNLLLVLVGGRMVCRVVGEEGWMYAAGWDGMAREMPAQMAY